MFVLSLGTDLEKAISTLGGRSSPFSLIGEVEKHHLLNLGVLNWSK